MIYPRCVGSALAFVGNEKWSSHSYELCRLLCCVSVQFRCNFVVVSPSYCLVLSLCEIRINQ